MQRSIHIVNLDPAAENFDYPVAMGKFSIDIAWLFGKFDEVIYLFSFKVIYFFFLQILENLFHWMMLWRSLDWVPMVVCYTAWSILFIIVSMSLVYPLFPLL